MCWLVAASPGLADTLRIATYNAELRRDGPGLLLRDILRGEDAQIKAVRDVLVKLDADIVVLQRVDYDHGLVALRALRDMLADGGLDYPHIFARPPNTGVQTGLDLTGDGRLNSSADAQGFGRFFGQGAMAILSRHAFIEAEVEEFTSMLWRDLPGARLPVEAGQPFPSEAAQAVQRLSSVAHWVVPVALPDGPLHLLTFHAAPPAFDGPEKRNILRNHDEIVFWQRYLDGAFGPPPAKRFVLLGGATIDPVDGPGLKEGIIGLLEDPRLQDPAPMRPPGPMADSPGHRGDPRLDTVAYASPVPGHLRGSYILPSADLRVEAAGILWPAVNDAFAETVSRASRHRPVWVDLALE